MLGVIRCFGGNNAINCYKQTNNRLDLSFTNIKKAAVDSNVSS